MGTEDVVLSEWSPASAASHPLADLPIFWNSSHHVGVNKSVTIKGDLLRDSIKLWLNFICSSASSKNHMKNIRFTVWKLRRHN